MSCICCLVTNLTIFKILGCLIIILLNFFVNFNFFMNKFKFQVWKINVLGLLKYEI